MSATMVWPAVGGAFSAIVAFTGGAFLLKRQRIRARRKALRARLFK